MKYRNLEYRKLRFQNACRDPSSSSRSRALDDYRCTNFSHADMDNIVFAHTSLVYSNLRSAKVRYADLVSADLRFCDLRHADMQGSDMHDADMRYTNMRYANTRKAHMKFADLRNADMGHTAMFRCNTIQNAHNSSTYQFKTDE